MFKIAYRNVLRNKRRSFMSILITVFGVAVLYLVLGYNAATNEGLRLMAVEQYGDLQIAASGYWDEEKTEQLILTKTQIETIKEILGEEEAVQDFTTQLNCSGILGTEIGSTITSAIGIEPGNNLTANYAITSGLNLFAGDHSLALLGEGVKKKLKVETGEWVSIMATTLDGAYNAGSLEVSGSFTMSNTEADGFYIILPLTFVQNLLNTDGVENFLIRLTDTDLTPEVLVRLEKRFAAAGLDLEIKTWSDLSLIYHQIKGMFEMIFFFTSTVIFILVFFSVLEIMSMAFFERMNEIGTIRSIGTKRRQVFLLLVQEGLILGILGGGLGIISGWGVGHLINHLHISYIPPSFSAAVPLYIEQAFGNGIIPFIIVLCSTVLSALYPAVKASRLDIVQVLRHV